MESYISENLPEKYREKQRLMLYLYDILINILKTVDEYKLTEVSFKFSDELKVDNILDEVENQKI